MLAKIRMTFIMLTILILVLLSLLLRLVFTFLPKHLFLRFYVRFVIYPFSRLLMRIVGVKLVVQGKMPSSRHLIVSKLTHASRRKKGTRLGAFLACSP